MPSEKMKTRISFLKFWAAIGGQNMAIPSVMPAMTVMRATAMIANTIVI